LLPTHPFGEEFLKREWPFLCEACSLPRDEAKLAGLAAEAGEAEALFRLAEAHGVIAHLAGALSSIPQSRNNHRLIETLRSRHRTQLLFTLSITAELFRILEIFHQSGIESILVKGPALSVRAYGDTAARQYVDLDLLVRHRDIEVAAKILVAAGYDSKVPAQAIAENKIPGEYLFRRPGTKIIFELHTERTFRYFPRALPINEYFERRTTLILDGHEVPALSAEDEFVLISIHGAKHFWERLMWISDIAAMVHNCPELNWMAVRKYATKVGAERMVRVALSLAERLLGVAVPAEFREEVDADSTCEGLVQDICGWLPYAGFATPPLKERALFRFRMRGRFLAGASYLTRLSLSTTEEDWTKSTESRRSGLTEAMRRPFRLARKYRRDPES
jgi:Uncharacterised nucleotidyltransferase